MLFILKEDLMRSFSLSDNSIYSIYKDYEGEFELEQCLRVSNSLLIILDFC